MKLRRDALAGIGAAAVGALAFRTWKAEPQTEARRRPAAAGGSPLPNPTLYTHEGEAVRFYDDLVRGRVVAINMMYTRCEGSCPRATSNLLRVQQLLGERLGRSVCMYSLTLRPEEDTPSVLKQYAALHKVAPGWKFLTGAPADIWNLRRRLGFWDPDPRVDGDKARHTGMVRIGNDVLDRWTSAAALSVPAQILSTINHVDRAVVRTA